MSHSSRTSTLAVCRLWSLCLHIPLVTIKFEMFPLSLMFGTCVICIIILNSKMYSLSQDQKAVGSCMVWLCRECESYSILLCSKMLPKLPKRHTSIYLFYYSAGVTVMLGLVLFCLVPYVVSVWVLVRFYGYLLVNHSVHLLFIYSLVPSVSLCIYIYSLPVSQCGHYPC